MFLKVLNILFSYIIMSKSPSIKIINAEIDNEQIDEEDSSHITTEDEVE